MIKDYLYRCWNNINECARYVSSQRMLGMRKSGLLAAFKADNRHRVVVRVSVSSCQTLEFTCIYISVIHYTLSGLHFTVKVIQCNNTFVNCNFLKLIIPCVGMVARWLSV